MIRAAQTSVPGDVTEGELKLELLLDLGAMIAREVELDELLKTVGERVATALEADRATLWLLDADTETLRSRVANLPELSELSLPTGRGIAGFVVRTGETVRTANVKGDDRFAPEVDERTGYETRSVLCTPLEDDAGHLLGAVQVLNKRGGDFTDRDEVYLRTIAEQLCRAFEYTTLRSEGAERGIPIRGPFNHIVGASPAMESVYEKVLRAAGTEATVLLRGETGTGKGLFARAIHVNSERRDGPLITVDCTNLPASLVESELFGHERGAYTGADRRVVGKVEMADGGTLFLDELGELPLALQGKLLRFLQERQFERVGGRETIAADVRVVAATNRDLAAMVGHGDFRSDLYYRVRVIDIELPTLAERGQADILSLAEHFLSKYSRRYRRSAMELSDGAKQAFVSHSWPGNVRELEHAIERAVMLSPSPIVSAEVLALDDEVTLVADRAASERADMTLDEAMRAYVKNALARHDGNQSAAARALGIGRNRLARLLKDGD